MRSVNISCKKLQDLQIWYKTSRHCWNFAFLIYENLGRKKCMGKKKKEGLQSQVKTGLGFSPTCFEKPALHRAPFCWTELPDHITLWPQPHFIAVTTIHQFIGCLTQGLHFPVIINMCKESEISCAGLWKNHSHCSIVTILDRKKAKWTEKLDYIYIFHFFLFFLLFFSEGCPNSCNFVCCALCFLLTWLYSAKKILTITSLERLHLHYFFFFW